MELRDREFFVYRIASGYLTYKDNNITLYIHNPNVDELYEAQEYALKCYEDSLFSGMYTREDIRIFMRDNELWTDRDDDKVEGLPKEIEDIKVKMFESLLQTKTRESLRKHLRRAEDQFEKIMEKKYCYDAYTCEGFASYCKTTWIIENCTKLQNGSKIDWQDISLFSLMSYWHASSPTEKEIRELARTEPFRTRWSASKEGVFKTKGFDLTDCQAGLVLWSKLYDGVQENPDCPSDDVVDDDDLFDGWLISERRKRETEKNRNDADSYDMNHDEIFIPAQTQADQQRIDDLNDPNSKMVKQQRHNQIEQDGSVKHGELGDVRRDKQIQANQQYRNKVKG